MSKDTDSVTPPGVPAPATTPDPSVVAKPAAPTPQPAVPPTISPKQYRQMQMERDHYLAEAQRLAAAAKQYKAESGQHLAEVRRYRHGNAWQESAKAAGVKGDFLADSMLLAGYKAESDEPAKPAIEAALKALKASRPHLFEEATTTAQPAPTTAQPATGAPAPTISPSPATVFAGLGTPMPVQPTPSLGKGAGAPSGSAKPTWADLTNPAFVMSKSPQEMRALLASGIQQ